MRVICIQFSMHYLFVIFQIKNWWLGKDVCLNKFYDSVRKIITLMVLNGKYYLNCDNSLSCMRRTYSFKKCTAWVKPIMYWYKESRVICSGTKLAFYNILERKRESLSSKVDKIDFWWQAKMLCSRESMRESWINKVVASR